MQVLQVSLLLAENGHMESAVLITFFSGQSEMMQVKRGAHCPATIRSSKVSNYQHHNNNQAVNEYLGNYISFVHAVYIYFTLNIGYGLLCKPYLFNF